MSRSRYPIRRLLLLVAAGALFAGAQAAAVQAKPRIYFAGPVIDGISQVNLDGTGERSLVKLPTVLDLSDLKVDATRAYWSDPDFHRIGSVRLDGTQANDRLIDLRVMDAAGRTTGVRPSALSVQGGFIYFAWSPLTGGQSFDSSQVGIGRARSDGTDVQLGFIAPQSLMPGIAGGGITSLAVDGIHIYWADSRRGTIGRARLDGSDIRPQFIQALPAVDPRILTEVAVSPEHVYWTSGALVGRANLDATDAQPAFRSGFSGSSGIAISREHLYWSWNGAWQRMNLDGADRFACFFRCIGGGGIPPHIAISPATAPQPSPRCSIAKRSVVKGKPLLASCPGIAGRVTVTVAQTFGEPAAAPEGSVGTLQRVSRTVRKGGVRIDTKRFCRSQYNTERFRILFTRDGHRDAGAVTVRVRSATIVKRCRPQDAGDG